MVASSVVQSWDSAILFVIVPTFLLLIAHIARRPDFPKGAPKRSPEDWPVIGSPRFFSQHSDFNARGLAISATSNFSFYLGKHQIVSISAKWRKTYFEDNSLNAGEGYTTLFTGTPRHQSPADKAMNNGEYHSKFGKTIILLLKKEYVSRRTPVLAADVKGAMDRLIGKVNHSNAVMEPFVDIYRIVWQQTNRLVGANEIANSPDQLNHALSLFEVIAESASPLRVMFPMLPTFDHIKRMVAGARLHSMLQGFVDNRKASGKREDDALQFLMDAGEDQAGTTEASLGTFIAGGLFAGQLNTGVNAACLLIYLATNADWYKKVRKEVDSVLLRYGAGPGTEVKEIIEVMARFSLEEWTGEFPLIDVCLKETIRFQFHGTFCRKNTSGRSLSIAGSNEIIPKDAFAIYCTHNCHFNSDIYSEPFKWNPGRYMDGRSEDKKEKYVYLGWGVGRHSCLGMTAAKIEVAMVVSFFVALFDFHLVDGQGQQTNNVPMPDRNRFGAWKPRDWNPKLHYRLRYP